MRSSAIVTMMLVLQAACHPRDGAGPHARSVPASTETTAQAATEPARQNKEIIRRLYEEAINRNDPNLLAQLIAQDFAGPRGESGPAGFGAAVNSLRAGMPDLRFTVLELLAEGDAVAVRWTSTGTHTGTLRGIPPSGKRVTDSGIAIYHLSGGKVKSVSLQVDRLGFLQQIGVLPKDVSQLGPPE